MTRHFVRINDDLLLIEIIRRLRHQPISGIDYVAYPGTSFEKVLEASTKLLTPERVRELLQQLSDIGAVYCTGYAVRYFVPHSSITRGLIQWWHPDASFKVSHWFTPNGTPMVDQKLEKVRERKQPCMRVRYKQLYVADDGIPKSLQVDVRLNRVVFSRKTFPLTTT